MRSSVWLLAVLASAAILFVSACGDDDDGGASATPDGTGANGEATTAPPADGDGDGRNGDTGSAIITFFGDVDGAIEVSGMSCDHFPNATDDDSDDSFSVSISGMIGDEGYTLDLGVEGGETVGRARLVRSGEAFGSWDNDVDFELNPESGSITLTDSGGEAQYALEASAVDPGTASEAVTVAGSWTCPGGVYATFGE